MSQLDTIVNVVIDVQTASVAQTSFGTPLVAAAFAATYVTDFGRAQEYGSLSEMAAAGFATSHPAYLAVAAIFRQDPRPATVVVGRRAITGDAGGADANWADALTAIQAANDSWYFTIVVPASTGTADAEVSEVSAWVESASSPKIHFAQSSAAGILSPSSTTDVAATLKAAGYKRTALMYRAAANLADNAPAGWTGEGAPFAPGSSTWCYKSIAGSAVDALGTTAKNAVHGKNANTYTLVAGANITQQGKVASGEWIDVVIGIDWLKARLQETVYGAFVANRKIGQDDGGITIVAGLVQGILEEAGRKGILQLDSIKLTVPKYADIPQADKIARKLPDVKFSALLQGAIHLVEIQGTVSV